MLCGVWDLSSLTRDQTHIPCIGRWTLNHWTTRLVPCNKVLTLQDSDRPLGHRCPLTPPAALMASACPPSPRQAPLDCGPPTAHPPAGDLHGRPAAPALLPGDQGGPGCPGGDPADRGPGLPGRAPLCECTPGFNGEGLPPASDPSVCVCVWLSLPGLRGPDPPIQRQGDPQELGRVRGFVESAPGK